MACANSKVRSSPSPKSSPAANKDTSNPFKRPSNPNCTAHHKAEDQLEPFPCRGNCQKPLGAGAVNFVVTMALPARSARGAEPVYSFTAAETAVLIPVNVFNVPRVTEILNVVGFQETVELMNVALPAST